MVKTEQNNFLPHRQSSEIYLFSVTTTSKGLYLHQDQVFDIFYFIIQYFKNGYFEFILYKIMPKTRGGQKGGVVLRQNSYKNIEHLSLLKLPNVNLVL